jgi:hypothetical protein
MTKPKAPQFREVVTSRSSRTILAASLPSELNWGFGG